MAFVLHPPPHSRRRVKLGMESGMEYEERSNPLDVSYLELLAEDDDARRAAEEEEEEEAPSTPLEALEKFTMALGEMDVIVDLATNLQAAQVLDFKVMTGKARSSASALQEACEDRLVRFGRRHQDLRDVSTRLKQGARDLQAAADQDNDFYQQAAQLQRYWRLRANPRTAEFANAPFSVELNLTDQPPPLLAQHGAQTTAGAAAAIAVGGGPRLGEGVSRLGGAVMPAKLSLMQGPCGRLRVQVDARGAQAAPSSIAAVPALVQTKRDGSQQQQGDAAGQPQVHVAVGTRAVHRTLLSMQSRMLWHMVEGLLDADARTAMRGVNNFAYSLAHRVITAMAAPHTEPWLAALRPLVLEHVITNLLPAASIAPPPKPPTQASAPPAMLPCLASWLHHAYFRSQIRSMLDKQVQGFTDVSIHWISCSQPLTSVLQIRSAHKPPLLTIMRESKVEVEGMLHMDSKRWSTSGRQGVNKQELPQLLNGLLRP